MAVIVSLRPHTSRLVNFSPYFSLERKSSSSFRFFAEYDGRIVNRDNPIVCTFIKRVISAAAMRRHCSLYIPHLPRRLFTYLYSLVCVRVRGSESTRSPARQSCVQPISDSELSIFLLCRCGGFFGFEFLRMSRVDNNR